MTTWGSRWPEETRVTCFLLPFSVFPCNHLTFDLFRPCLSIIGLSPVLDGFTGVTKGTKFSDHEAPAEWFRRGAKLVLDLGKVKDIAELSVNGKAVESILWKPLFQADVTGALMPGKDHLEIKVTNLWPNRMIGDLQPSAVKRYRFTDSRPCTKDSPLLESGLLGPVRLYSVTVQ